MSQSFDLDKMEKDARQLVAEDGLLYIFLGVLLLIVGLSFSVPALSIAVAFAAFLYLPVEWIRERVTYPRLGYAKFCVPANFTKGIIIFIIVAILGLGIVAFAGDGRYQRFLPLAVSVVFALSVYFGFSTQGIGFVDYFLIALILIGGVVTTWLFEDWREGLSVLFFVVGGTAMLIGVLKFLLFLRKYPNPVEIPES